MHAGELLGSDVFDVDGRRIGKVHDIRLVRAGPTLGGFGPAYRVSALIVGAAALGTRLGYDRADVRGPRLLSALFGALHSRARSVPWERIERIGAGRIDLAARVEELPDVPLISRGEERPAP